jgi:hypothetical protein
MRTDTERALVGRIAARSERIVTTMAFCVTGAGRLLGNLCAMERDQLKNYVDLLPQRRVGAGLLALAAVWSPAKYLRRVALTRLRLLSQEAKPR